MAVVRGPQARPGKIAQPLVPVGLTVMSNAQLTDCMRRSGSTECRGVLEGSTRMNGQDGGTSSCPLCAFAVSADVVGGFCYV